MRLVITPTNPKDEEADVYYATMESTNPPQARVEINGREYVIQLYN